MWQVGYQQSKVASQDVLENRRRGRDNDNLVGDSFDDGSADSRCMKGLATAILKPGLPLVSANCVVVPWPRCCSRTLANLPANSESPTCRKDRVLQITGSKFPV